MNFDLTEEHLLIQESAKDFAQNEIFPSAVQRDKSAEFPYEIVKKMGELGFMGMMVSPDYGGAGLDTISYVLAMIEISKVDASVGVIMSVNNSLVCSWIGKVWIRLYKTKISCSALLKVKNLVHLLYQNLKPEAMLPNKKLRRIKMEIILCLNGIKNWITNGVTADYVLVMATTNKELAHKGISTFIVERGTPGFDHGVKEDKLGIQKF